MKKMMKSLGGGGVLILLLALPLVLGLLGCPQDSDSNLGSTSSSDNIGPPLVFDEPESYTQDIQNLPNPFKSWRGYNVTADKWDLRREEIKLILQYYEYGYLPSMEGVTKQLTAWQPVGPAADRTWYGEITLTRGGVSGAITFNIRYPDPATLLGPEYAKPAKGWPSVIGTGTAAPTTAIGATGTNLYYLQRGIAVGNVQVALAGGTGQSGTAPSRAGTTLVTRLYQPNYMIKAAMTPAADNYGGGSYKITDSGDRNAPSSSLQQVWGFSRGLDGFELAKAGAGAAAGNPCELDTNAFSQTGTSIGGKMALMFGAFDERVLLTVPVASGAGGAAIERFISPTIPEELSLDRTHTGFMNVGGVPMRTNKAYQYVKLIPMTDGTGAEECIVVLPSEALKDSGADPAKLNGAPTCSTAGGNAGGGEYQVWSNSAGLVRSVAGNNVKEGYGVLWFGFQVDDQVHEGYQTLTDYRFQYGGGMFNSRFHEFVNLYPTLNTTAIYNPGTAGVPFANGAHRAGIGYLTTMPFDHHFLAALVAPRGLYITGACADSWTNPEGMFFNFLATREVYRLLGKEKNVGYRLFVQAHTTMTSQLYDQANALHELHNGRSLPAYLLPDGSLEHPYTYTLKDPRSRYDYIKLDWAAPGYTSIADQVKALLPRP